MDLGWMRPPCGTAEQMSVDLVGEISTHADRLGFSQIWLPDLKIDHLNRLARPRRVRLGIDLSTTPLPSPRQLANLIRAGQSALGSQFLLGVTLSPSKSHRIAFEQIETLLSEDPRAVLPSDLPMDPPRAEVLVQAARKTAPDLQRGAAAGFSVLSPAWQELGDVARHWAEIVAAATHATRRARPAKWHVARLIFVSDDPGEITAYREGIARDYLRANHPEGTFAGGREDVVVAGPASAVAAHLEQLRRRIGPVGMLHVLDPGLSSDQIAEQMSRIATDVLPWLRGERPAPATRELETT